MGARTEGGAFVSFHRIMSKLYPRSSKQDFILKFVKAQKSREKDKKKNKGRMRIMAEDSRGMEFVLKLNKYYCEIIHKPRPS